MKGNSVFITGLWALLLAPLGAFGEIAPVNEGAWSRATAIEQIEDRSRLLRAERWDVRKARGALDEAQAIWWPRAVFTGNASAAPGYRGGPLVGGVDTEHWGPVLRGSLEGGMPIFGFGQLLALRQLGEKNVDVAEAKLVIQRGATRLALERALLEGEYAEARQTQMRGVQEVMIRIRESAIQHGTPTTERDIQEKLILMEAELAEERIALAGDRSRAERNLLHLLADEEGKVSFAPLPLTDESVDWLPLEACLDLAKTKRPEWLHGRALLRAGEEAQMVQRLRLLPGIGLLFSYSKRYALSDTNQVGTYRRDPRNGGGFSALLAAEWDLDIPSRWSDIVDIDAEVEKGRHALLFLLSNSLYEVTKAYVRARGTEERLNGAFSSAYAARGWLGAEEDLFGSGMGSMDRVWEAFRSFRSKAKGSLFARYQYVQALASLDAQVGDACFTPTKGPSQKIDP